jgi:hypothetical protein
LWADRSEWQDSLAAAVWIKLNFAMRDRVHLTTWLDRTSKARFGAIAQAQGVSESALLRRLVEGALMAIEGADMSAPEQALPIWICRFLVNKVSRPTWTLIPAEREHSKGHR